MRDRARKRHDEKAANRYGRRIGKATEMILRRKSQLEAIVPLREKAYREAVKFIGVMEQGGNNVGPEVEKIIKLGGGLPGQAWCGWFQAAVYKLAGSKAVTWAWGAVRLYVPLSGISKTRDPQRGDLVRFTFDHIGMFEAWCDFMGNTVPKSKATHIRTVEANTGESGAVSDSKTGGDGVYRKVRSKSLVKDYLRVTR